MGPDWGSFIESLAKEPEQLTNTQEAEHGSDESSLRDDSCSVQNSSCASDSQPSALKELFALLKVKSFGSGIRIWETVFLARGCCNGFLCTVEKEQKAECMRSVLCVLQMAQLVRLIRWRRYNCCYQDQCAQHPLPCFT